MLWSAPVAMTSLHAARGNCHEDDLQNGAAGARRSGASRIRGSRRGQQDGLAQAAAPGNLDDGRQRPRPGRHQVGAFRPRREGQRDLHQQRARRGHHHARRRPQVRVQQPHHRDGGGEQGGRGGQHRVLRNLHGGRRRQDAGHAPRGQHLPELGRDRSEAESRAVRRRAQVHQPEPVDGSGHRDGDMEAGQGSAPDRLRGRAKAVGALSPQADVGGWCYGWHHPAGTLELMDRVLYKNSVIAPGARRRERVANAEKEKAIELAVSAIEKQFGKGSVMRLGVDEPLAQDIPAISTGSVSLDLALGVGGVPRGRIVEIYGPESSGKTTLTLHVVAEAQKNGGVAAFIDAEHALDVGYARKLGVRTEDLLISQPDTGEQALEICEMLVRSGAVDVIVIDSVAALVPRAELEGEMGDQHMGLQARLMSQALRKLTATISKSNTTVVFINQIRMKIGVMFGNPETTTGGNALKFYASQRLDIRRIGAIKDGETVVGNRTRVKVVKNKVAPPFREVEFDILYGQGISREGDLLDLAVENNIVEKSGAWFSYGGERIGQGRENARDFLKAHPDTLRDVEARLYEKFGIVKSVPPPPPVELDEKRARVKAVK